MKLTYQGTDITAEVRLQEAWILDYAGGKSDRAELCFDDPEGRWARWNPQKGDALRLRQEGFSTGDLYVDEIRQRAGMFRLGAVSVPPALRDSGTRAWQAVRFSELLAAFAERAGMTHRLYGMRADPLYHALRQQGEEDIAFLANRCMLESCMLKVTGGALVAYDQPWLEAREETTPLSLLDGASHEVRRISQGIYAGCVVQAEHTGAFRLDGAYGPTLTVRAGDFGLDAIHSDGEAERYAKGILRAHNKREYQADCLDLPLMPQLAAGSLVTLTTAGIAFPGKWVVEEARHQLVARKTTLKLRKPLEGY